MSPCIAQRQVHKSQYMVAFIRCFYKSGSDREMPLQPRNEIMFWVETRMSHHARNMMSWLWRKHSLKAALFPHRWPGLGTPMSDQGGKGVVSGT